MAQVIDTTGTKKTTANTTVATNPVTTPQQAFNYIFKTPTNTITTKNNISSLSPSTLPNIAKQAANDATVLGAFNFANGGNTSTTASPDLSVGSSNRGSTSGGNTASGGTSGSYTGSTSGSRSYNYTPTTSYTGYSNPRSSGITMVGGSSYFPDTSATNTAKTDVALPEETSFEAKLKELLTTNNDSAKTAYDTAKEDTDNYLEQQLKDAYISRMLAEKALPQQMAAQGLNGGAVESILAGNRNNYMNNRNDIYKTANEKLRGITSTYQNNVSDNQKAYTSSLADYLNQIDMLRRQADIDKELVAYKARFGG